jgi:hypothetical protein
MFRCQLGSGSGGGAHHGGGRRWMGQAGQGLTTGGGPLPANLTESLTGAAGRPCPTGITSVGRPPAAATTTAAIAAAALPSGVAARRRISGTAARRCRPSGQTFHLLAGAARTCCRLRAGTGKCRQRCPLMLRMLPACHECEACHGLSVRSRVGCCRFMACLACQLTRSTLTVLLQPLQGWPAALPLPLAAAQAQPLERGRGQVGAVRGVWNGEGLERRPCSCRHNSTPDISNFPACSAWPACLSAAGGGRQTAPRSSALAAETGRGNGGGLAAGTVAAAAAAGTAGTAAAAGGTGDEGPAGLPADLLFCQQGLLSGCSTMSCPVLSVYKQEIHKKQKTPLLITKQTLTHSSGGAHQAIPLATHLV